MYPRGTCFSFPAFDSVWVSTDNDRIAEVALQSRHLTKSFIPFQPLILYGFRLITIESRKLHCSGAPKFIVDRRKSLEIKLLPSKVYKNSCSIIPVSRNVQFLSTYINFANFTNRVRMIKISRTYFYAKFERI